MVGMRTASLVAAGLGFASAVLGGCVETAPELGSNGSRLSFEEWKATQYREASGLYVLDGDVAIRDEARLFEIWSGSQPGQLAVYTQAGQDVKAGDPITDGPFDPKELMEIKGIRETQLYLVEEVQKVYRDQGVSISDKHIELIVRQMTRRVGVQEPGDTGFLPGERADAKVFRDTNRRMVEEGKKPAEGRPEIMGITKASLATESWLSAASFQETTRVLTEAAIDGKGDSLLGLKENIIIGKLIPAGTGMMRYREFDVAAPDYQPMAYFSSEAAEDPAAWLSNIHGTYSTDEPEPAVEA